MMQQSFQDSLVAAVCPICQGREVEVLYTVDAEAASGHLHADGRDRHRHARLRDHVQEIWQGRSCRFLRCKQCQFCFAWPFVAGDSEFYSLWYEGPYSAASWRWEFQMARDDLLRRLNSKGRNVPRVLEIGAGDGAFLRRITPALVPKENVLCLEYSESGAKTISDYGVMCVRKDVRSLQLSADERRFDVVFMFHVLEHMGDLDGVFRAISQLTNENADLFIAVPNAKQRAIYDGHGVGEDVPPAHISRWNKASFEILAERHGWLLVRHETENGTYLARTRRYLSFRSKSFVGVRRLWGIRFRTLRMLAMLAVLPALALACLPGMCALAARGTGVSQYAHLRRSSTVRCENAGAAQ